MPCQKMTDYSSGSISICMLWRGSARYSCNAVCMGDESACLPVSQPHADGTCKSLAPVGPGVGGRGAGPEGGGGGIASFGGPRRPRYVGQPARWAERLSGDGSAAGARRRGGDSLILKLRMEKRAEDKNGCFYASVCYLFCAFMPGKFRYF